MPRKEGPFWSTYQDLKSGRITRREFIARATALGVGLPITLFVLNSMKFDAVAAQESGSVSPSERPAVDTEGQTRGAGGELKLLQWQAPSIAFSHKGTGTKDWNASSLVLEPLFFYAPDGTILPNLTTEVPSKENGGLSEDLTTVTINLQEGILWSDGEPLTADDVVFTWQWVVDPANASTSASVWTPIANIEATSPTQAVITFAEPSIAWFVPLTGTSYGAIIPQHILGGDDAAAAAEAFLTNPIGTGPYKVDSFKENDQVIYSVNENYREPNKPYFATVNLKGGGDASSAAQAVLQTGDWHHAWNLQVEPEILRQLEESGGKGTVITSPPSSLERVNINFSDPNKEVDGERSSLQAPHPFLTDIKVREALSLATDRESIANEFYLGGDQEPASTNYLVGIGSMDSPNTTWEFNVEKAKTVLEEAGWVLDGDVRKKDGMELSVAYYTSINSVRQKTQAVNKRNWEEAGFKVQLGQVTADVFFSSAPGNDQTFYHNYRDIDMFTDNPTSTIPLGYMLSFYAGPDNFNVSQKSNQWTGGNQARYVNPEYDALYDQAVASTDAEEVAELCIQMNDVLIEDFAVIPLVARAGVKDAASHLLLMDNLAPNGWETSYWNIANWTLAEK
ncbi:MAG: peptide ABC transporter substrate-binding protein [Thermomicrobiales bacterium]|nr:peptide ABC transporter substrate-binding protein [Thermomicrobiales bacterium]